MKNDRTKMVMLQCSVVFDNHKTTIWNFDEIEDTPKGRNKIFRDVFSKMSTTENVVSVSERAEYITVPFKPVTENFFYSQLAVRKTVDIFEEQSDINSQLSIEKKEISSLPFLWVFVDLDNQIFFIELKDSIINHSTLPSIISEIIQRHIGQLPINMYVSLISNEKRFWEIALSNVEIHEIQFELIAPNIFGFRNQISQTLKETKEIINSDEIVLSFQKKDGYIRADHEFLDEYVKYSSSSGGWKIKTKKNGETTTFSSKDKTKIIFIDSTVLDFVTKYSKADVGISRDEWNVYISKLMEAIKGENQET
jgi:hypothetical protein